MDYKVQKTQELSPQRGGYQQAQPASHTFQMEIAVALARQTLNSQAIKGKPCLAC